MAEDRWEQWEAVRICPILYTEDKDEVDINTTSRYIVQMMG